MKTILLATVATLSLGASAAFAQGLPAGFHEPAYGSQAFAVAPLSLGVGAAYAVGNADPTAITDSTHAATLSISATSGGSGVAIATIDGATTATLSSLLAHSIT
jgi:hypothetical protein